MKEVNKLKTIRRVKIVLTLITSFVVVSTVTPRVFVANSPEIKGSFLVWLKLTPQRVYAYLRYPADREARTETIENAALDNANIQEKEELNYTPISEGVYAAEDPETNNRYIKIEKGTTVEVHHVRLSDGREVKVYVPVK